LEGLDAADTFVISDGFRVCTEGQRPKAKMGRIEEEMVAPYEDYRRGYNWIACQVDDRNWAVGQDINPAEFNALCFTNQPITLESPAQLPVDLNFGAR